MGNKENVIFSIEEIRQNRFFKIRKGKKMKSRKQKS